MSLGEKRYNEIVKFIWIVSVCSLLLYCIECLSRCPSDLTESTLVGVAQWIGCGSENQRVTSSIPRQGTCLSCWSDPQ